MIETISSRELSPLKISDLMLAEERESIAYMCMVKPQHYGATEGMCVFQLKDVTAQVVRGVTFNIHDIVDKGMDILNFRRKFVKIKYKVEEYLGQISLKIYEVSLYNGSVEKSDFIGKVEGAKDMLIESAEYLSKICGKEVKYPTPLATASLGNILNGTVGGFAKVVDMSTTLLLPKVTILEESERKIASLCLYKTLLLYYSYQAMIENKAVVTTQDKMQLCMKATPLGNEIDNYLSDCYASVTGLATPQTVFGYLICECIFNSEEWLNLIPNYKNCIKGCEYKWTSKVQTGQGLKELQRSCVRLS